MSNSSDHHTYLMGDCAGNKHQEVVISQLRSNVPNNFGRKLVCCRAPNFETHASTDICLKSFLKQVFAKNLGWYMKNCILDPTPCSWHSWTCAKLCEYLLSTSYPESIYKILDSRWWFVRNQKEVISTPYCERSHTFKQIQRGRLRKTANCWRNIITQHMPWVARGGV